jgi:hypothetical protein
MWSLLSLALIATLQVETSATPSDGGSIILQVTASPKNCNVSVAKKLALETLMEQPDQWAGECVAVKGYWYGQALFSTPSDARQRYSYSSGKLDGRRVGIYGQEEILKAAPRRPQSFVVVGIADTCERLHEGAIMVTGYCHYTGGPMIAVAELHPLR